MDRRELALRDRRERLTDWLWDRYGPALRRYVEARLGSDVRGRIAPDAVVNDVLLELATFEEEDPLGGRTDCSPVSARIESLAPYRVRARLYLLARFRMLDAVRRERRRSQQSLERVSDHLLALAPSPSGLVAREEILVLLEDACSRLPDGLRAVVERRAFEGETFVVIGEALGIGAEAARKRFAAGLSLLRRSLGDLPDAARSSFVL